jgi:hypothetical protein
LEQFFSGLVFWVSQDPLISEWLSLSQDLVNFLLLFYWICSIPLACLLSPSMPMILRFGFLVVSQRSCIFHLYSFTFFLVLHLTVEIHLPCLWALIFCLQFDPLEFFIWLIVVLISRISVFFQLFLYLYWIPLSYHAQFS